jgi:Uma2 family endonuclease
MHTHASTHAVREMAAPARLSGVLGRLVKDGGLGRVVGRDQALRLPAGSEVAVDAAYFSCDPLAATLPWRWHGALPAVPDLVMELGWNPTRRNLFEQAGVREYWVVDGDGLVGFLLEGGRYRARKTLSAGDSFASDLLPGVTLPVSDLLP